MLLQERDDVIGQIFGAFVKSVQDQFGSLWPFVGRIQAGEVAQLAAPRLSVESFWIALLADFKRCIDKNLNEFIRCH